MPEPSSRLVRSAGLAGAATLVSRLLGLVRDQVFAGLFGAGNQMDAFVVAYRIPNLVRDLFAEGAMSAAFVPTFSRYLTERGRDRAWRLGNHLINALALATLAAVAVGMLAATPLVSLVAGDFRLVPGKLELTIQLTRLMLPFLVMVALAAAMMGMLNSLHHYFVPALAPATFNVAVIVSALTLTPLMPRVGMPAIAALAVGILLGGVGQVAVQWWPLYREGFRYRPQLDVGDAGLRRVLSLMGPGTVGLAATQANVLVTTLLATGQGTGAASWLTYAFRVMYLPIGLFGVSIATAVLPTAAHHVTAGAIDEVRRTVGRGLSLMLLLSVPATLGLMVLAGPIVQVIFERGQFLPSDTEATAAALRFYAIGLLGYSAARIASPVFYALGRSHVPVAVSVGAIGLHLATSLALVQAMGFRGLALSTSLAALAHGGASLLLLRGELGGLEGRRLATLLAKIAVAALVMAGVALTVEEGLTRALPDAGAGAGGVRLGLAILAGIAALVAMVRLLRVGEFDDLMALVGEQLRRVFTR